MSSHDLPDPNPSNSARFIGRRATFDHNGRRLAGLIAAQEFTGYTERGNIPDYKITVRGDSGRYIEVSLVESYMTIQET